MAEAAERESLREALLARKAAEGEVAQENQSAVERRVAEEEAKRRAKAEAKAEAKRKAKEEKKARKKAPSAFALQAEQDEAAAAARRVAEERAAALAAEQEAAAAERQAAERVVSRRTEADAARVQREGRNWLAAEREMAAACEAVGFAAPASAAAGSASDIPVRSTAHTDAQHEAYVPAGETFGECAICMDIIHLDHARMALSCGHLFHKACILGWLRQEAACAICRTASIVEDDKDREQTATPVRRPRGGGRGGRGGRSGNVGRGSGHDADGRGERRIGLQGH